MNTRKYLINYEEGVTYIMGDVSCHEHIANNLGNSWEDFLIGKYVPLSEEQTSFMIDHPNSSFEEIFFMTIKEQVDPSESEETN